MDLSLLFLQEKKMNQWVSKSYMSWYNSLFNHIRKSKILDLEKIETFTLENTLIFFRQNSKNWKPEGYNYYRKIYNVFVKYLVREYKIYDFTPLFKPKKEAKKLPKLFEKNEINKILKNSNEREKNIMKFFLYSGVRKFEFLNLKKSDIKNWIIKIKKWKWEKERLIPIHNDLKKIINKLDYNYTEHFLDNLWKKYKKIVKNFHWHRCRHTFATNLVMSWVDIYSVSQLLGHSSIETTTIYLSLNIDKKREALEKLNFWF